MFDLEEILHYAYANCCLKQAIEVKRSDKFECICVKTKLPSGHIMLVCGLYHPPKPSCQQVDLIDYITDLTDTFLDEFPDGTIVVGGDLNKLDLVKDEMLSGLKALLDFPTRGNSIPDNCLTNNSALFSKCYSFKAQIKTDHEGVMLPPGIKLKPLKYKYTMHDYREHRRIGFHSKLLELDWDDVYKSDDVNTARSSLHFILKLIDNS